MARLLLETCIIIVASPAYLKKHGLPAMPVDIADHTCIHFRDSQTRRPFDWKFRKDRKVVPVTTHGPRLVSDAET